MDTMGRKSGEKVGLVGCHGQGGNQVCTCGGSHFINGLCKRDVGRLIDNWICFFLPHSQIYRSCQGKDADSAGLVDYQSVSFVQSLFSAMQYSL